MSKLLKIVAVLLLIVGAIAVTPRSAEARWGWHGGWGHHWGGWGHRYAYYPRPYYYSVPYYAAPYYMWPRRWVRVHYWRRGFWGFRRHWW